VKQNIQWLQEPAAVLSTASRQEAEHRQSQLTKPAGSLGRLEEVVVQLAAMQGTPLPRIATIGISVFAGDHGVAVEGVSAFPQAVTTEMVRNFARGGAAISVLARELGASLEVVNLGTVHDPGPLPGVLAVNLGSGTANFLHGPAMEGHQLIGAMNAGRASVERVRQAGGQLFIGGEMGIGNTTTAAALACVYTGEDPGKLAGPGTGLDQNGVRHKVRVLERALAIHAGESTEPLEILRRLGGFEIAALAGAYLSCAQSGLPVLVDGFISSVAALAAVRLCPGAASWFFFSHASAEPGHRQVLAALQARPLLDLSMRLGEGSGAAVAVPLLRLACSLHAGMATFDEAMVSKQL
jgi:nicotinate-nucleotide--dimethylbenzimidazole phosphoribosyltransferase